jgi:hypothetical protein
MTTLIANELRKLRTIGGPWLLLAAGPVLVIVGVAGDLAGGADLTQPQTASHAVAHAGVVSLLALIFGITAVAGEYRHKTITDTYLATPRRGRVIAAKFAVYTAVGAVFGLMLAVTAVIATAVAITANGHRHRPRLDRARRRADRRTHQRPRGVVAVRRRSSSRPPARRPRHFPMGRWAPARRLRSRLRRDRPDHLCTARHHLSLNPPIRFS